VVNYRSRRIANARKLITESTTLLSLVAAVRDFLSIPHLGTSLILFASKHLSLCREEAATNPDAELLLKWLDLADEKLVWQREEVKLRRAQQQLPGKKKRGRPRKNPADQPPTPVPVILPTDPNLSPEEAWLAIAAKRGQK
jgi:hypothetical protein